MYRYMLEGLLIPLAGTSLGAVFVIFAKKGMSRKAQCYLNAFAAGVMMAASVWSLLIPAIEQSGSFGRFSFVPAVTGFWLGIFFLSWLHKKLPCVSVDTGNLEEEKKKNQIRLLMFAIVIHNIPEGMAVGAVYADWFLDGGKSTVMAAFVLSAGIAVQNIPEGAIISLPLCADGMNKRKACLYGVLSGVVEPAAGGLTILLSGCIIPALPYLLSFSAGAMVYVVVEELVPCAEETEKYQMGTFLFSIGFSLMMILDVALG